MGPPFVGRAAELGVLQAAVESARARSPQVVLVEGDAGIGKTMLLRHFLDALTGVVVVRASGEEVEAALPFGVLDGL